MMTIINAARSPPAVRNYLKYHFVIFKYVRTLSAGVIKHNAMKMYGGSAKCISMHQQI
jgi:hypothetical protein